MSNALNEILELPIYERLNAALKIWDSVTDKENLLSISPEQELELNRRFLEFQNSPSTGIDWSDAKTKLEEEFAK